MPLSDLAVRSAKPGDKPFKLADERGLFLLVTPAGGKLWRFKFRFGGKEQLLSFGNYPDGVALARYAGGGATAAGALGAGLELYSTGDPRALTGFAFGEAADRLTGGILGLKQMEKLLPERARDLLAKAAGATAELAKLRASNPC